MIALGLFALIAMAGFTLLDGIIGTRDRLDGRLARVGELQRALYVVTLDFEAIDGGDIEADDNAVGFRRQADAVTGGTLSVRYDLADGNLRRTLGNGQGQTAIAGVTALEWRFFIPGQGWASQPSAPFTPAPGLIRPPRARAVEMTVVLDDAGGGLSGRLRRVVELPVQP